jgi:CBS domain containing-hemolysin-like protein
MDGGLILLCLACAGLSFLLSGMEAGVFALNRLRIRGLMRQGKPRAAMLHEFLERPENFLWTILVGNTLANVIVVSTGVVWLHESLGASPARAILTLGAGLMLFYVACELFPKTLFRRFPNRLCLLMAVPFRVIHLVLRPLVAPMAWLSRLLLRWTGGRRFTGDLFGNRDELRQVMQETAHGLTGEERTMINRVLDLQHLRVRDITTPLERVVSLSTRTALGEVMALARERRINRFPVWTGEGRARRVVGLLNVRSLFYRGEIDPDRTAGDFLKPALYLEDEMRLELALRQMQRTGQRLAIVLGRDRSEIGIVTLQDILHVIFGEVKL